MILLLACVDPPPPEPHKLADLYHPAIQLNTGREPGKPEEIQVLVHAELNGPCHPIERLEATLDGRPLTRLHGKVAGPVPYDRDCSVIEFALDAGEPVVAEQNELVVTDGATTFRMKVAGLFSPRTLTAPDKVKAGQAIELAWSPSTDVVAAEGNIGIELRAGEKRVVVGRKNLTFTEGRVTFTMPELEGPVDISVVGTLFIQPPVTTCEGATKCEVTRVYTVEPLRVTVAG